MNHSFRRELRCLRNTIHVNLFVTYIMSSSLWIIILSQQVFSWSNYVCKRFVSDSRFMPLRFLFFLFRFFFFFLSLFYLQLAAKQGLVDCIFLVTLFHYFSTTNFFWMLVEGKNEKHYLQHTTY